MKLTKKISIICLLILSVLSLTLFVACNGDGNNSGDSAGNSASVAQVTVSFETNGGSTVAPMTVDKDAEITMPATTRSGYDFTGWYNNAALTGSAYQAGAKITASADATYYAAWEVLAPTYALTLDPNGGTLATTTLQLKEGANVYDAVANLVPTKADSQFGAWFNGQNELSKNTRMPASAMTLTAKYKVKYVVEIYEQNLAQDGYELADTVTDYEYEGQTVVYDESVTGFAEAQNAAAVTSITVSANVSENVLKYYYDRETYRVTFNSNYARYAIGVANKTSVMNVVYGQEITVPDDLFEFEGYYLTGWSTSQSAAVSYKTYYLENNVFNAPAATELENDKFAPDKNVTLFAQWKKGYNDMFGGSDYLFRFDNDTEIYLLRGGVFFLGQYDAASSKFTFYAENGDVLVSGQINANYTYCYIDEARASYSAFLYNAATGPDTSVYIHLDNVNGITYSVENETGTTDDSKGDYFVNDEGEYVVTYTSGPLSGTTMTMRIGTITTNNSAFNVFSVRNDAEYNMGELVRYALYQGNLTYYLAYQLVFDGYGTATFYTAQNYASSTNYYYAYDEATGRYDLYSTSNRSVVGSIRIYNIAISTATQGYLFYYEELDHVYEGVDGSTLELNGYIVATYTDAQGNVYEGFYNVENDDSMFGEYVINFYPDNGENCKFILSEDTVTEMVVDDQGLETPVETTTYIEEKVEFGFAEYYYHVGTGVYYGPYFVMHGDAANTVDVYVYRGSSDGYALAATGTYVMSGNRYVLTLNAYYLEEAPAIMGDINDIKTIEFNVNTYTSASSSGNSYYPVNYWYSFTDLDGVKHTSFESESSSGTTVYTLSTEYTSAANGTVVVAGAFIEYTFNDDYYVDQYGDNGGVYYIDGEDDYILFILDDENKTFELVNAFPHDATVAENGLTVENASMAFDAKDGATYTAANGNIYQGTVTATEEESLTGYTVYVFEGVNTADENDAVSFKFIQVYNSSSSTYYVMLYNATFSGEFESESDGYLKLDGFGFAATYVDATGESNDGIYYVSEENGTIVVLIGETSKYFDYEGTTFTLKGEEYGSYYLLDNRYLDTVQFILDGYGKATVRYFDEVSEEWTVADENSTYVVDGEQISLSYTFGAATYTYVFTVGTFDVQDNTYNVLIAEHKEVAYVFVNSDDWTVIKLDAYGNAVRYNEMGVMQEGTYTLIDANMFYFVDDALDFAGVYTCDVATALAAPLKLSTKGYFTADLEALLFSQYGYATFNNTERYYYNVDAEGNVTIYHKDPDDEKANEYGYVSESFGKFENSITYGGKTYYANDGFRINFTRAAEGKDNYPVRVTSDDETLYALEDLAFAPTGEAEFSVTGSVLLRGDYYNVTVVRAADGEGGYEMYLTVGSLRFDLSVNYTGNDNTYTVTALTSQTTYYPYGYMQTIYYMFLGMAYSDYWGNMNVATSYAEDGTVASRSVSITFNELAAAYVDANGEYISVTDGNYAYDENVQANVMHFVGADGYSYALYFVTGTYSNYSVYQAVALTRLQQLTDNGYVYEVETVIASDVSSVTAGSVWTRALYKLEGETANEIALDGSFTTSATGVLHLISRTTTEGTITASTYYDLTFTYDEDANCDVIPYESVVINVVSANVYYDANGLNFVETDGDGNALILGLNSDDGLSNFVVYSTEYDALTGIYHLTLVSGREFNVTISGTVATITELERVTYTRAADNASAYNPNFGDITFVVQTDAEFEVNAIVSYGTANYRGTLHRVLVEGTYSTYLTLTIGTNDYYVSIEMTSGTDDAGEAYYNYSITGVTAMSPTYYSIDYAYALQEDPTVENTWGTLTFINSYAEDGTVDSSLATFRFGEDSQITYADGSPITVTASYSAYDNVYVANFAGADGYKYALYFQYGTLSDMNVYQLMAITRVESFVSGDYTLEGEVIIGSEYFDAAVFGEYFNVELYYTENDVKTALGINQYFALDLNTVYFVVREYGEDGLITASTYYYWSFTLDDEANCFITPHKAATMTGSEKVNVYYTSDSTQFVEISATKGVLALGLLEGDEQVVDCILDTDTGVYLVTSISGDKYYVTVTEGVAAIEATDAVTFARAAADAANYYALSSLSFVLDEDEDEYEVTATAVYGDGTITGTLTVLVGEDGMTAQFEYEDYLFELEFDTDNMTYVVTAMYELAMTRLSYTYYDAQKFFYDNYYEEYGETALIAAQSYATILYVYYYYGTDGEVAGLAIDCFGYDHSELSVSENNSLVFEKATMYQNTASNFYYAYTYGSDGLEYCLRFRLIQATDYQDQTVNCFAFYALTRIEELTVGDYTVAVQTFVSSDYYDVNKGDVYSVSLYYGDDYVSLSGLSLDADGNFVYASTETDENGVDTTTYYVIALTKNDESGLYTAAKVTVSDVTYTYYDQAGTSSVTISTAEEGVVEVVIAGSDATMTSYTYDSETDTYVVLMSDGTSYTVTISDTGAATFTPAPANGQEE